MWPELDYLCGCLWTACEKKLRLKQPCQEAQDGTARISASSKHQLHRRASAWRHTPLYRPDKKDIAIWNELVGCSTVQNDGQGLDQHDGVTHEHRHAMAQASRPCCTGVLATAQPMRVGTSIAGLTWMGMHVTAVIHYPHCMACGGRTFLLLHENAGNGPGKEPGHIPCISQQCGGHQSQTEDRVAGCAPRLCCTRMPARAESSSVGRTRGVRTMAGQ